MHQHKRALEEACVSPQPLKVLKQMRDEEQEEEEEVVDVVPEENENENENSSSPRYKVAPQCIVESKDEARENSSSQEHSGLDVQECASSPAPRVWEAILPPVRRLVRIDPSCQAEVPAWDPEAGGAAGESGEESSYYLGQRLWPRFQEQLSCRDDHLGRGREIECECEDPGSIECVRRHIGEQRRRVAAELGPAFGLMGFEEMGDVVAGEWSEEEQRAFKSLVMMNPQSQHRDFWAHLRVAFPARSTRELVSYYFNVFMLRRRALQNRFFPQEIDSDFDEGDLSEDELEFTDSEDEERASILHHHHHHHHQSSHQMLQEELLEEEDEEDEDEVYEEHQREYEVYEDEACGGGGDEAVAEAEAELGKQPELPEQAEQPEQPELAEKRMSFADTEAEIMRLATIGGNDSWLPSAALELTSTNGAMQEIFGGSL